MCVCACACVRACVRACARNVTSGITSLRPVAVRYGKWKGVTTWAVLQYIIVRVLLHCSSKPHPMTT